MLPNKYRDGELVSNYCRNPGSTEETIWCYTTDIDKRRDFCDPVHQKGEKPS